MAIGNSIARICEAGYFIRSWWTRTCGTINPATSIVGTADKTDASWKGVHIGWIEAIQVLFALAIR